VVGEVPGTNRDRGDRFIVMSLQIGLGLGCTRYSQGLAHRRIPDRDGM